MPGQEQLVPVNVEEEMKRSYLDYAMSVIIGRALPDVRDGFKPVHRRVLYTMHELGLTHRSPYKKSARVVGDCLGKLHPHGDQAVYDTIVRMVQDFSLRYPLVDGQGNFGCFTGDTKILLVDGTTKTLAELASLGSEARFYVYSVNRQGRIVIGEGRNARVTRRNAELVEVLLDNGKRIRCTPDHRFMLRDGTYKQAKDLTPADSLMAGYFDEAPVREGTNTYLRVRQPDGDWTFVHWLADEFNLARDRYTRSASRIRHHKDFNRFNNSPDNIERLSFAQHNQLHAEHAHVLWLQEEFREEQRKGVKAYYASNPDAIERLREQAKQRNQSREFRSINGLRLSKALREYYASHPEKKAEISSRKKVLWEDPNFRAKMSEALRGLEKRELSSDEKARVSKVLSEKSREMWANPEKRTEIVQAIRTAMVRSEVRQKLTSNAKRLWENFKYRSQFPPDHHRNMAKALWLNPSTRELHRAKLVAQQQQESFRKAQRDGVSASNRRRMSENPAMMAELNTQAKRALREKWRQPSYRARVMRSKITGYVSRLLREDEPDALTPELFDSSRDANWIPRFSKAIQYFSGMEDLFHHARTYNHRVVSVRRLQEWEDVYDMTVDEHHNFLLAAGVFVHNSVDGDEPAAMRYTEVRLAKIAQEMLRDIEKETVDFAPNFDGSLQEPKVLPATLPNLLVNGSSGIAVGMATNIPPHNLGEVVDALLLVLEDSNVPLERILKVLPGPDLPTAGFIHGQQGILEAYRTGRGLLTLRAKAFVEKGRGGKEAIIVTELPYQVNKAKLLERIAELVREKRVEGISDLRDESDREGMRVVIELKKDEDPRPLLNFLYKHTPMQSTFGVIMLALVDNQPRILPLKELLQHFLTHRREVILRRTRFELKKAEERAHILEGYRIALSHLDAVITLIKGSRSAEEARAGLMERFGLTEIQAQAILDLKLQRLTGLERQKIQEEYRETLQAIERYNAIIRSDAMVRTLIKEELLALKASYADARRTEILAESVEIQLEDTLADEEMVIIITHGGYVKRSPLDVYRSQHRGGKGTTGITTKEEDYVEHLFVASTLSYILLFTNLGKAHWLKVHEIPQLGRAARGKALVNFLQLEAGEKITAMIPIRQFEVDKYLLMTTQEGIVKKTELSAFSNPRTGGIIAITLDGGDELIAVGLTKGDDEIFIGTKRGMAIRFKEQEVRPMGRSARGVIGIALEERDKVVGMEVVSERAAILTVTERGYGKRTALDQYRLQGRGGKGIINVRVTGKNGAVVGIMQVAPEDEFMMISQEGKVARLSAGKVSLLGRATQGVRLQDLAPGDRVAAITRVVTEEE